MMHNEFILVEKIEENKALQLASKKSWERRNPNSKRYGTNTIQRQ